MDRPEDVEALSEAEEVDEPIEPEELDEVITDFSRAAAHAGQVQALYERLARDLLEGTLTAEQAALLTLLSRLVDGLVEEIDDSVLGLVNIRRGPGWGLKDGAPSPGDDACARVIGRALRV